MSTYMYVSLYIMGFRSGWNGRRIRNILTSSSGHMIHTTWKYHLLDVICCRCEADGPASWVINPQL